MKLPIYQIDAFTDRVFGGNPAAVVTLERWLPEASMQAIAAENNLAETAFVIPHPDTSPLRWFTPAIEVDLCGHATLAAGHVLLRHHYPSCAAVRFSTRSGILEVRRQGERLCLDLPARPARRIEESNPLCDALCAALGARPSEAWLARDLLAVFAREEDVASLSPDFARVANLDAFAVIASAPGREADFVSRFFAPRAGVPEDPVTGSAHCTLVPYWAARLGKTRLDARQLSVRAGRLACELQGERVTIAGGTIEYLRGEIEIPD